jgi:hypothetical protein
VIERRIPPAGDPFTTAADGGAAGSTRHHRCDADFLRLLAEDFGIDRFSLTQAFLGVPPAPKRQAIAVCAWAEGKTADRVERGVLVRRWAKNRGVGMYHPTILAAPPLTWEQSEHERRVREGEA